MHNYSKVKNFYPVIMLAFFAVEACTYIATHEMTPQLKLRYQQGLENPSIPERESIIFRDTIKIVTKPAFFFQDMEISSCRSNSLRKRNMQSSRDLIIMLRE